ncbi:MAG: hypothetical protein V3R30_01165 [Kiloniellales bacterium]
MSRQLFGQSKRGGRPKGVPNKVNRIAKEAILEAEPHVFLVRIMEGRKFKRAGSDAGRKTVACYPMLEQSITAAENLLRKICPDVRATELSGPGGQPIEQRTELIESAKRVAEVFTEVADTPAPAEVMTDESLGAVQAVNFVLAQKEAAERAQEPAHTSTPPTAEDRAPEPSESVRESTQESEPPAGNPEPPDIGHTLAFIESDLRITAHEGDRPGLPPVYQLHGHAGPMRRGPFDVVLELARKQAGGDLGPWIMQEPQPSIAPARVDQRSLSVPLPQVHRSRRQT